MPLQKLQFRPGINKEGTNYANEGGFYSCDKIRFRSGYPEKLGGWINQSSYTFSGVARQLWNWVTFDNENLLGVGTSQKFYVQNSPGSTYRDITPLRTTNPTVTLALNPITTTLNSRLVTISHTGHGASANSFVSFSGATAVGGITISGEYEIVSVTSSNAYVIIAATAATSGATGGGAAVVATYQLDAGAATYTVGSGYGTGGYGLGGYGAGTVVTPTQQLRIWSNDNYEDDLVACPRGLSIYYWTKNTVSYPRMVLLKTTANSVVKSTTTGTSGGAGTTITVGDSSFIDVGAVVTGTNISTTETYVTNVFGTTVTLSTATTGAASGLYNFSYAGRYVPDPCSFVISSDTNHFTIACGTSAYDPTSFTGAYDPMLVRWSDQDNPYEWVPNISNQSGEQHLANGSYLVTGVATRQEILIWSDAALFTMQYIGPPYVWKFDLLMDNLSIASPNAVTTINSVTYWMGVDKFYQYSGRVETLPCSLRQFIFGNINRDQIFQVISGSNEGFNEVWWHYPSANSLVNDTYVIYNHLERIWYYGSLNRTAWEDSPLRPYPMAAYSVQISYLPANITNNATNILLYNALSYPNTGVVTIDSEKIYYTGISGNTLTGCTRGYDGTTAATHNAGATVAPMTPNQIMYHEYGTDDQTILNSPVAIDAYIESSDFDIGDGHNFGYVWRMLPDVTFSGSTATNPVVTMTVRPRVNSGSNYSAAASPTVTLTSSYPIEQYTGEVFTRIRGRQMSFSIESTGLGVTWQLGAVRLDLRPDGRR